MGRLYTELECGCLVSCDGGGGVAHDCCDEFGNCQYDQWSAEHEICEGCGQCLKCSTTTHEDCLVVKDWFVVDDDDDMYQGVPA